MINVDKILSELTREEKVCLLSGHKSWFTNKVSRVGLSPIMLTDGPHGLRKKQMDDKQAGLGQTEPSTCFPAACTSGSTWNKDLLYKMGVAMGEECRYYDVNLILGPAVNIKRNPFCGRNFEYFSEDPHIAGQLGARLTRGIEDMGVGTSVKHFACNNNEANRYFGDSIVDERAYREIYLKAFEPIIKEGRPQTVMCAYNKVNGVYASENRRLLTEILRDDWGFEGLVMSDWGAVNDRVEGLKAGLDLEMPGDVSYNRQVILDALNDGSLDDETLDRAVRRVLNMIYNTTVSAGKLPDKFNEHSELAKTISTEGAVLLKNEGNTLPLDNTAQYLVVGEMFEKMRYQGAGSSLIRPYKLTTPKDAFDANPELTNLLLDPYFTQKIADLLPGWRKVVAQGALNGMPTPAFSSALAYYDGYRCDRLPANLLQAQRDYFGAHTYERIDADRGQFFHTNWTGHGGDTAATQYVV